MKKKMESYRRRRRKRWSFKDLTCHSAVFSMVIRRREMVVFSGCSQLATSRKHECWGMLASEYLSNNHHALEFSPNGGCGCFYT